MSTLGELWAVAGVAGPIDVRVFIRGVTSYKRTVGNTPVMLVTDGVPADALIVQNIGLFPIELGPSRGLSFGQGISVPARSQWAATGGVQSIWASPNYYDRNPADIVFASGPNSIGALINANGGAPTIWTYTVPASRRCYVELAQVGVQIQTAYANDNQHIGSVIQVQPTNGLATFIAQAWIWTGVAAGTRHDVTVGASIELQPGDVVNAIFVDGRAAGAGASMHLANMKGTEFDA